MATLGETRDSAVVGKRRELLLRLLRQHDAEGWHSDSELLPVEPDPARRHEPFPLTEIQQAYWIGRSGAYDLGDVSIHAYVEVEGEEVDLGRLERSWNRMVARHDMLRAVVLPDGTQRVLPSVPRYELSVVDLRGHAAEETAGVLAGVREELSHQVLDAEVWPGFDIRASLLDGGRTRVHVSVDLVHVDGGSLMILLDEWMRLYRDGSAELPPLDLSYRDYALGEIALRDTDLYERSARYWSERVATLPPAPALPFDHTVGTAATRFRRRSATLGPETWLQLKARALHAGLTPSAVLLAAYADVLACWSRDPEFTVNVTLFNRLPIHPQVNRILGDFTSMLLLPVAPEAGTSFKEHCARAQKELWAGLEHRHVSGIRVLRDLARAQGRTAGAAMPVVFTSLLDLAAQGFRPPFSSLRALGEVVFSVTQTPQVWLDHQVLEEGGALVLTWDSVEDIFPAGLLDDMFAAYVRFLRRLAADETGWTDPGRSHVPPEQLTQRASVNGTDTGIPDEIPVAMFLRQAALRPDQPAIVTSERTLTYAEVRARADRLGRTLRAMGATVDAPVAVVMEKGWEQAVATLGIHLAGAPYVPVDPALPEQRRRYLFEHSQVRLAVTQPCVDERLDWPAGVERVCVDADDPPADGEDWLSPVNGPRDLSHVIYTSGSTGEPKGVMIEHRSVANRMVDVNRRLGVGPGDRVLALTALHHDLSVYDIFGALAAGATMVVPDAAGTRDPGHWADLMIRHGVTMWNSVPAFLQMLVEYVEQRPEQVPHGLRCAVLAGDWIPVTLPDRLRRLLDGVQLIASGGPTETTIWDVWYPVGDVDPAWPSIPYGRPMDNTRYHVLDGALRPCPVWVPGQLHIAGAGLARGYWRDEQRTRERFVTHPRTGERLYRSGDMGRYLPDGTIEFLGRDDNQVKIRGCRIELGEIEAALQQHPRVEKAVVTAAGPARALTHLVAHVVPRNESGKSAGFKDEQVAGIAVLDPVARIEFKLNQWGIRRDTDREAIALQGGEPDDALRRLYAHRRSVRDFRPEPLPLASFGDLLHSLTQIEMDGLPKYRYPSGGGLYPVQTYVYVKPGRVADLPGGVYYHDPRGHRLLLMSPGEVLDATTQMPHNRAIFDQAAFVILLVGRLAAVEPLYGGLGRDFCLLEAGYMSQLLMTVAPDHGIGLCPVGAMEFEPVRHHFRLDDSDLLVHLLIGGIPAPAREQAPPRTLEEELRAFLRARLPEQMQPAAYELLDSLPLTANGKVDRQRLRAAEVAAGPAQPRVPPRNDTERTLVAIAQEVLQAGELGIHQNFFDLGGSSIHMVQILNRVRSEFGRDLPVTQIFRHPTISSLAAYLSDEGDDGPGLESSDEWASRRRTSLARRHAGRRGAARS